MAPISTQEFSRSYDLLQGRRAPELSKFVSAFRERDQVTLQIDEYVFHLSPVQADLLAQGFLMAALRTGLGNFDMPWRNGQIHNVSAIPTKTSRMGMGINDVTLYIPEANHRFFATGWLYERTGEDLEYPENVVFLKTRLDGVVEFVKGNDEFLLSPKQTAQLCLELADSANLLDMRVWRILDKRIEWRTEENSSDQTVSDQEKKTLFDYLKSCKSIV
jgi:hypothetical protein